MSSQTFSNTEANWHLSSLMVYITTPTVIVIVIVICIDHMHRCEITNTENRITERVVLTKGKRNILRIMTGALAGGTNDKKPGVQEINNLFHNKPTSNIVW